MLIAQQSIAPSAGREDDGGEKKRIEYKTKIHSIRGKVEKNTNNGMKQTNKQKQNAIFHKKN